MQHTTMLCSSVSDSLSVTGLDDIGYGQDDATGLEADTRKEKDGEQAGDWQLTTDI